MSETNGTGIEYPTIELGGKLYIVKFTRGGIMYRLSKAGVDITTLGTARGFSSIIDMLHAALFGQYLGDAESLAELVINENKTSVVSNAINEALGKAFPPTQTTAAGAAEPAAAPVQ